MFLKIKNPLNLLSNGHFLCLGHFFTFYFVILFASPVHYNVFEENLNVFDFIVQLVQQKLKQQLPADFNTNWFHMSGS